MKTEDVTINPREISMPNIMALTARLAQVLAEEADLLAEMKVKQIEPLQKEKIWLTRAVELQIKRMKKYPDLLAEIEPEEREEFAELMDIFTEVRDENYRRLLAAKEVNQRVVEAIAEVVNEQCKRGVYNEDGDEDYKKDSVSVTLNKVL